MKNAEQIWLTTTNPCGIFPSHDQAHVLNQGPNDKIARAGMIEQSHQFLPAQSSRRTSSPLRRAGSSTVYHQCLLLRLDKAPNAVKVLGSRGRRSSQHMTTDRSLLLSGKRLEAGGGTFVGAVKVSRTVGLSAVRISRSVNGASRSTATAWRRESRSPLGR